VEKYLGPPSRAGHISYCNPRWGPRDYEGLDVGSCRYLHPLGTITIEYVYSAFPGQKVKIADFVPVLSWAAVVHVLAIPFVLVVAMELSQFLRRKFDEGRLRFWNWRDWGVGLIVVAFAFAVGAIPGPLDLEVLRPGTPRTAVEKHLGWPSKTVKSGYRIALIGFSEEQFETETCWYSHPQGTIEVVYRGCRDQRVERAEFVPEWNFEGVVQWLAIPVVLVVSAGLFRCTRAFFKYV
jgi:hypothetical protein